MWQDLLQKTGSDDLLAFTFGAFVVLCGVVLTAIYLVVSNWRRMRQHQLDIALKQDMLDRGMSAADIERVMGLNTVEHDARHDAKLTNYPTPSDVVVEWEEDWYPAILLKTDGGKYYVHYKGYDEEEWVTLDRIRFPAQVQPASPVASEPQHVPTQSVAPA